jgi:TolB-like protein
VFFLGIGVLEITAAQEKPVILDEAIQGAQAEIESDLALGTKVVVINFTAPTARLSDYVIDRLIAGLVKNKKVTVIERKDIGLVDIEMAYQFSGEVSDESAQAVGMKLGAQSIVSGKFEALGDQYQFSIKTIHVESAAIELFYQIPIKQDKKLNTLLNITGRQTEQARNNAAKQNAPYRQAVRRETKLLLGVRSGIGGIASLGNQADGGLSGTDSNPLFPEQVYSVYFGTSNLNSLTGFQVEGNFHLDTGMEVKDNDGKTGKFSYTALDIPVLFRLGVAEGRLFSLFWGPYVSFPLSGMQFKHDSGGRAAEYEIETLFNIIGSYGVLGGISMGFKLGPGYLAVDGRYAYDFNIITIRKDDGEHSLFRRRGFNVSLGYELWL